jgi:hypothetical protein
MKWELLVMLHIQRIVLINVSFLKKVRMVHKATGIAYYV